MREPRVGDVWDVDFGSQVGKEQAGFRPVLVISIDQFYQIRNDLYIVAPITGTDRDLEYHVRVEPPEGGLTRSSLIMCEQEKSQSSQRFLCRRGNVSDETLRQVDRIVGRLVVR